MSTPAYCVVCTEVVSLAVLGEYVRCDGMCKMYTHQKCAAIPRSVIKCVNETPSLHYYCTKCTTKECDLLVSVAEIKEAIGALSTRFDNIVDNVAAAPPTPFRSEFPELSRTSKRRRMDLPTPPDHPPPTVSSHTINRPNLLVGSTVCDGVKSVEQRKSVVASMIHPSTEPAQLESFLIKQLKLPDDSKQIRCTLLLPKGKTAAELNWVSFRVSAPDSSFALLQNAALWPQGVVVREFVQRPRALQPLGAFLPPASQTAA